MSQERCPSCGGLVGPDAEWCGQCLAPLRDARPKVAANEGTAPAPDVAPPSSPVVIPESGPVVRGSEPDVDAPAVEAPAAKPEPRSHPIGEGGSGGVVRVRGEALFWECPACGTENALDAMSCSVCGTPFRRLLEPPGEARAVDPGRARAFSLVFPGLGHIVAGRRAEGIARAIVFAFALVTGIAALVAGRGDGPKIFLLLMTVSLLGAAVLYVTSMLDAGRLAEGTSQFLSTRMLLYGAVGLIVVTLLLMTMAALQSAPQPIGP